MKRIVLIKSHANPTIAHVYEHMFCYELERFFLSLSLYTYIDYSYEAITYRSGIIQITIHLFTDDAQKLELLIKGIKVPSNDDSMDVAVLEVMSEKQVSIDGDYEYFKQEVKSLSQGDWYDVNSMSVFESANKRRNFTKVNEYDAPKSTFKQMTLTASINNQLTDSEKEFYWPLFYIVAEAITNNITDLLARDYSYHGYAESIFDFSKSEISLKRKYKVHKKQISELTTEAEDCRKLLDLMVKNDFTKKISSYLSNVDYSEPLGGPDFQRFYGESGKYIGAKGWANIATLSNIDEVLSNLDITLAMGKRTMKLK